MISFSYYQHDVISCAGSWPALIGRCVVFAWRQFAEAQWDVTLLQLLHVQWGNTILQSPRGQFNIVDVGGGAP